MPPHPPRSDVRRLPWPLLGLGWLLLWWATTAAPAVLEMRGADWQLDLGDGVMLHDPTGRLDALAVLRAVAAGRRDPKEGSRVPEGGAHWLVATLRNVDAPEEAALLPGNPLFERVDVYLFAGERLLDHHFAGKLAAAESRLPSAAVGRPLPFAVPRGEERTVALRVETALFTRITALAMERGTAERRSVTQQVVVLAGLGALAALILYNLFFAFGIRDDSYIWYALHVSAFLVIFFNVFGLAAGLFGFADRELNLFTRIIFLSQLFGALFCYRFLDIPRRAPPLRRAVELFMAASALLFLLFPLLPLTVAGTVARLDQLLLAPLLLGAALLAVRRGYRPARYILVGWGVLIVTTLPHPLSLFGLRLFQPHVALIAFFGVLFETFVFSLALADRIRELRREKIIAEETSQAKSTLLATVSHEIRTPMSGVLGMVELLRHTPLDPRQQEYVETLHHSGNALLGILDGLLDYAKAEAGRIELERVGFDLRRLVRSLVLLYEGRAREKGIELRATVADEVPPHLCGDPARLRQVLVNLLGNAVKFTAAGKIELRVEPSPEGRLRFAVCDTGIGIPPQAQRHLFDQYHQADPSIARRFGGTGLGLAIAREIVAAMGGAIGIDSQPGRGSTFHFDLDLPAAPSAAPDSPVDEPPQPALKVLVVDDVEISRNAVAGLLQHLGHRVTLAADGREGVACAFAEPFDLILMDVRMPGMDGLEATRHIRAATDPRIAATPILGCSASIMTEEVKSYLAAGMNGVLAKPVTPESLRRRLRELTVGAAGAGGPTGVEEGVGGIATPPLDEEILAVHAAAIGTAALAGLAEQFGANGAVALRLLAAPETAAETRVEHAHRLAGMAATLGLPAVAEAARAVEQAAQHRRPAAEERALRERLEQHFQRTATELERYCAGRRTASAEAAGRTDGGGAARGKLPGP